MQHLRGPDQPGPLRPLRRVATVLVSVLLIAALGWFVVLPHARPRLEADEQLAVDVSNHQGSIDWTTVAGDGIGYAYLKASEGRGYIDPFFARNWAESDRAGVRRGAYHFFTLCAPGAEQAANFLRVAAPDPDALPPAVDLEILGGCPDRPDPAAVAVQLADFVGAVEREWRRPLVIYARSSWTDVYPVPELADRPQWRTSFVVRPRADWAVWQVHYFATVDGITGRVDLDVVRPVRLRSAG